MKRNSPASPSARIRAATTNSSLRRLILSIRAFEGSRNDLNNKPIRQNRRPKNFPMSRQCVTVRHSRNIICYVRSEEHTSELQSLMRISYAVFCLKKHIHAHKKHTLTPKHTN